LITNEFEAYIGGKEVLGIYLKRFFPKLLHRFVLKSKVRLFLSFAIKKERRHIVKL